MVSNMLMRAKMLSKFSNSRTVIDALADVCNEVISVTDSVMDTWPGLAIMMLAEGVIGT